MKLEDTMVESVTKFFPEKTNCDWLNDNELEVYTNTFFENGFQSALNWYRCMTSENQNKELNAFHEKRLVLCSDFQMSCIYTNLRQIENHFQKMYLCILLTHYH